MSFSELCCEKASLDQLSFSSSASAGYQQPSMANGDFGELIWENGQIVIKGGQSSKVSRVSNMDSFINSKTGISGTSSDLGFHEVVGGFNDADVTPWFYHLDNMIRHESPSGVLGETSGVTSSGLPSFTNFSAARKLSNHVKDSNALSLPYSGSRFSSVAGNGVPKYAMKSDSLGDQLTEMKLQKKQDKQVQAANFSLYRHVARSNYDSECVGPGDNDRLLLTHEITESEDEMLVETNGQTTFATRKCLPSGPVEKQANAMLGEDGLKSNQVNAPNVHRDSNGAKMIGEAPVAPPSLCSDNSGLRASNNPTNYLKRKHSDEEDCESSSEDTEEESISLRKAGCKRNRAAEVHNFNERKRREKINEKIRALQELIPNCNKVDKATMLNDAIEYLRVLQFQVQMMSMRSHMCPSPTMPQPGLQHVHAQTHFQQFMPMGFGMGMGHQVQAGTLNTTPGFHPQAACFPGPSNPSQQLWHAAQGIPMSMSQLPGLSGTAPAATPAQIPGPAAEYLNSAVKGFTSGLN